MVAERCVQRSNDLVQSKARQGIDASARKAKAVRRQNTGDGKRTSATVVIRRSSLANESVRFATHRDVRGLRHRCGCNKGDPSENCRLSSLGHAMPHGVASVLTLTISKVFTCRTQRA